MTNRYDSMDLVDRRYVASGIGGYAARLERITPGFGHPGDDTGRVAAGAYRDKGAEEAARILRAFKQGYDAQKLADGKQALDDDNFINTVGLALSVELEKEEINEIKKVLSASPRPLTSEWP